MKRRMLRVDPLLAARAAETAERLRPSLIQFWNSTSDNVARTGPVGPSEAQMRHVGKLLLPFAELTDNVDLVHTFIEMVGRPASHAEAPWLRFHAFCPLWARLAFPAVDMSPEQAATLMFHEVAQDDLEGLQPPWPAFIIRIPPGTLTIPMDGAEVEPWRVALLHYRFEGREHWSLRADMPNGQHFWCEQRSAVALYGRDAAAGPWADTEELDGAEERAMHLLARLTLNTCLLMTDGAMRRRKGDPKGRRQRKGGKRPKQRAEYELLHPVRIDARDCARAFVRGDARYRPLRWIVRGHFRRVPCGPGRAERRRVFVPCHAAHRRKVEGGAEEAPLAVREHVVADNVELGEGP